VAPLRGREAFGDRALQDGSRIDGVARVGQASAQSARRDLAPQILERNETAGPSRSQSDTNRAATADGVDALGTMRLR